MVVNIEKAWKLFDMKNMNSWSNIGFIEAPSATEAIKQAGLVQKDEPVVAVLSVPLKQNFKIGFKTQDSMQFFQISVKMQAGMFAMRLGDEPVTFFAIPEDSLSDTLLTLAE